MFLSFFSQRTNPWGHQSSGGVSSQPLCARSSPLEQTCHTSAVFLFRIITVSHLSGGVAPAGAHDRCGSIWEERNASLVDGHFFRLEGGMFLVSSRVSCVASPLQSECSFAISSFLCRPFCCGFYVIHTLYGQSRIRMARRRTYRDDVWSTRTTRTCRWYGFNRSYITYLRLYEGSRFVT